jgi:hypothetical protein
MIAKVTVTLGVEADGALDRRPPGVFLPAVLVDFDNGNQYPSSDELILK